jgi:iron complex transport system substrate-binding protein
VDGNGETIVFDSPPERIVAFDSAVVEILFAIGEGDRVVGTHDFVTSPPEADDVPRVGGAFNMDIEATVALEPDLVFIFFDRFKEDLERAGLNVLFIATLTDDFNQVADRIRLWGDIVGNPENAETVAADFETRVEAITATMADYAAGPSVFQDEGALWTPGQGTLIQQVFDVLKLENIAADIVGYEQISPEVIVERNPAVIIASYGDAISGDPVFQDLLAVRNGSVYVPNSDALSIAGPRFVQGIEELARWVYPGLFP